ncbi:hypothetical protein IFO70_37565 [Phormidium tenue FACHB-886]|nr:hypothetical protein [Phormidium tenue FACHB-886]
MNVHSIAILNLIVMARRAVVSQKTLMGFKSFNTARRTLSRIEAMNMIGKERVNGIEQGSSVFQVKFIEVIFGITT